MTGETQIRLLCFAAVFGLVALWEVFAPRRQLSVSKVGRWWNNLAIISGDSLLLKLLFPTAAIGVAVAAQEKSWGLFNTISLPPAVALLSAVLLLDGIIYLQHLMFHTVPILWRLHMVHHADLDLDVTSGLRFHPLEMILSMLIKIGVVAALGPPVTAVLIFEISLNTTAMFSHGNIRLPDSIDRLLRLFVVTPDMHRIHHSVIILETNSNFGFNFPWWDRIFGTYKEQPAAGHTTMTIGLSQYRTADKLNLHRLLLLPFTGNPGHYSLNSINRSPQNIQSGK